MSVLIKGMEKPEHCGYCRFRYDGICHAIVSPVGMQKMVESVIDVAMVACGEKGVIDMTETIEARRDMWLQIKEDRP